MRGGRRTGGILVVVIAALGGLLFWKSKAASPEYATVTTEEFGVRLCPRMSFELVELNGIEPSTS